MAKKVNKKQIFNTVGDVYMELVGIHIDQRIYIQLPDGSKHRINNINSIGHLDTMECIITINPKNE